MNHAILLDFGSTYTKVVCVDIIKQKVIATQKFPSTVHTDATIGLKQCFDVVEKEIGTENFNAALKLSTSSAAGGLRIAVSGLAESLSIEAGRNASFGAGGKIVYTTAGLVTDDNVDGIRKSGAEIILLCGGYEGGNQKQVIHNADKISRGMLNIPVIYAGNSYIAQEIRSLFKARGQECFIAENIIPNIGELNVDSTVSIIRNLFMQRIINMKGVTAVKAFLDGPIVPTPAAVLNAGQLLFEGTEASPGIGPYMLVDIGGATTDIYSFCENVAFDGAKIVGVPEPTSKRTVEGDMGMRESSSSLIKEVGIDNFAKQCNSDTFRIERAIDKRLVKREYIADNDFERKIDLQIACNAVSISAERHAGKVTRELRDGYKLVQRGKNLCGVKVAIGTGGILVNSSKAVSESILRNVVRRDNDKCEALLPSNVIAVVDSEYVFYAAGLLSEYDKEAAIRILKDSIGELIYEY